MPAAHRQAPQERGEAWAEWITETAILGLYIRGDKEER